MAIAVDLIVLGRPEPLAAVPPRMGAAPAIVQDNSGTAARTPYALTYDRASVVEAAHTLVRRVERLP